MGERHTPLRMTLQPEQSYTVLIRDGPQFSVGLVQKYVIEILNSTGKFSINTFSSYGKVANNVRILISINRYVYSEHFICTGKKE